MYTEEPRRRIDWGYVLRKVVIIVLILLILFLIIWLINRGIKNNIIKNTYKNNNTNIQENINNHNNVENINNDNGNLNNPERYSESFITNYMYFHDNARDYVEKNTLPEKNNSVKYSFKELINKGILLPVSYGNGTCDTESSYVIVTNNDGKYTMTTTLICGTEIAKVNEELKCSLLCNGCNNTKVEYEFKQAYNAKETVYSCPKGYTKTGSGNNTKCVKNNSNVVSPTKVTTYNCPSGYTKSGDGANTKCTKDTTSTVNATAKTTYSCEKGYTLSGTKCIKTSSSSVNANETTSYSCPKDYKLNGTKCTKTWTNTVDPTVTYSCKVGTPNSNHMCPTTVVTYSCSNGDLVNTRYCRIYTTGSYYTAYNSYYGKTYNGCSYTGSSTTPCTTCAGSTRTVYNYKCYKTTYNDVDATAVENTVYTTKATPSYSCTKDYSLNSDNKCTATVTDTKNATAKITYSCNKGYTLAGTKCVKDTTDTKNAAAKTTYSCTNGTLKDKVCIIPGNSTANPIKSVQYNCPSGYTKDGLAESATCTKGNVVTTTPSKSTKTVKKYRTKWSSETSLSGWTRTGKTRTVKAS